MRYWLCCFVLLAWTSSSRADEPRLTPLKYQNPGLTVDLGVGLWAFPLPMDFDGDGDLDLVVSCPDKPYNGTYFFENPSDGKEKFPVFRPGVKIGPGHHHIRVSYVEGRPRVLAPGREFSEFLASRFEAPRLVRIDTSFTQGRKTRANQGHLVDYNGDGILDVLIGLGDWTEYGWDDAWDEQGVWKNGPLRGRLYVALGQGNNADDGFEKPFEIALADGAPLEVYGWPSPNLADWDGDGDLDILCGEFLDSFTYFENVGTRSEPVYSPGRKLTHDGDVLRMDLQMIVPTAIDWDGDGDLDLIVGDEDGRVALVENTGKLIENTPAFLPPRYFQQQADDLKFGALATPFAFDWDGDGDEDLLCGNTAGHIGFFENLGVGEDGLPRWAAPKLIDSGGEPFRILAGPNGSIQGPCEAKWGYTTLYVADWDADGLPDILINSIWGRVQWLRNEGTRTAPRLAPPQPIDVAWSGKTPKPEWTWWEPVGNELATQWRTTPCAVDWNGDGLVDLVMLDHEGYLAFYRRERNDGALRLLPGERLFVDEQGAPLRLNDKRAGGSGRRKLAIVDWDGDGRLDVLLNGSNADWLRNEGERDGRVLLRNLGPLDPQPLSGHTTSPTTVDWNRDGIPDLIVGSESGYLYYMANPRSAAP